MDLTENKLFLDNYSKFCQKINIGIRIDLFKLKKNTVRVINNIIVTILLFNLNLIAQNREQIEIEFAPFMTFEESKPDATILTRDNTRQVHIKHEGIDMWCNQAIYYAKEDFVEAYGDVKVKQGDSLNMKSKYVEYSGKTQLAYASGDVLLIDNNSKLYTDILYFDRIKQETYYNQKGKVISDSSGVINSDIGRYYIKTKKYQFNNNVVLVNPEYVIETDRLDFYSVSGYAFLYGPTTITSESSVIYCERGFYNTNARRQRCNLEEVSILGSLPSSFGIISNRTRFQLQ